MCGLIHKVIISGLLFSHTRISTCMWNVRPYLILQKSVHSIEGVSRFFSTSVHLEYFLDVALQTLFLVSMRKKSYKPNMFKWKKRIKRPGKQIWRMCTKQILYICPNRMNLINILSGVQNFQKATVFQFVSLEFLHQTKI